MLRYGTILVSLLLPCAALAQTPESIHAIYETYAAGMPVAHVETALSIRPRGYQIDLGYHTTGMIGFFLSGHQFDQVNGSWQGLRAMPSHFTSNGSWHGIARHTDIEYQDTRPIIRQLVPSIANEREPVPEALQANTIDTLSALVELVRVIETTGRCENQTHTYDGRRAVELEAHTAGEEVLQPTNRSSFAGKTLRCDLTGHMQAGFLFSDDRQRDRKPMHGSAWLAQVVPGGPPVPVRLSFETKWFGNATMYLTSIGSGPRINVAAGN